MTASRRSLLFAIGLASCVGLSAVWAVLTEHESRRLFVELEALKREQDRLQSDWWRLQIEESTWATHARIEQVAADRLSLVRPKSSEIYIVERQ